MMTVTLKQSACSLQQLWHGKQLQQVLIKLHDHKGPDIISTCTFNKGIIITNSCQMLTIAAATVMGWIKWKQFEMIQ
jgi:hypothetical protein